MRRIIKNAFTVLIAMALLFSVRLTAEAATPAEKILEGDITDKISGLGCSATPVYNYGPDDFAVIGDNDMVSLDDLGSQVYAESRKSEGKNNSIQYKDSKIIVSISATDSDSSLLEAQRAITQLQLSLEEKRGLISYLTSSVADGGVIEQFTIYRTKDSLQKGDDDEYTYYGTYNGRVFYTRPYMDLSVNYAMSTQSTTSILTQWIYSAVKLGIDVSSIPISFNLNIFFAMLDNANALQGMNYTAHTDDYAQYYVRTVKHIREIVTYDDEGRVSTLYCAAIQDAKMNIYPYVIFFCNPEGSGINACVYNYNGTPLIAYSPYYNNKPYNLQAAYNKYYSMSPGTPLYLSYMNFSASDIDWSWY